jgi:hypothetical protein
VGALHPSSCGNVNDWWAHSHTQAVREGKRRVTRGEVKGPDEPRGDGINTGIFTHQPHRPSSPTHIAQSPSASPRPFLQSTHPEKLSQPPSSTQVGVCAVVVELVVALVMAVAVVSGAGRGGGVRDGRAASTATGAPPPHSSTASSSTAVVGRITIIAPVAFLHAAPAGPLSNRGDGGRSDCAKATLGACGAARRGVPGCVRGCEYRTQ